MTSGRRRGLLRAMALLVLVGAILPQLTYFGHWHVPGLDRATAAVDGDGHADHCHGSACAGKAASGLQWAPATQPGLTLDGGPQRAQPTAIQPSPRDPAVLPLDPPPRYA